MDWWVFPGMLPEKEIHGEGIILRALQESDLPRVVEWFNDPEFCKGLGREPGLTLEQETEWFESVRNDASKVVFAVMDETGEHLGNIALNRINPQEGSAMVSLAFGREFWGKGYGRKALKRLMKYAREKLGLREIYATIYPFNTRSIELFKTMDFVEDKSRMEKHFFQGKEWDLVALTAVPE